MAEQQDDPDDANPEVEAEPDAPRLPAAQAKLPRYHQKKAIRQLAHLVFGYSRDRRRIRELVLLKDRAFGANGARVRGKSEVRRHDRPEIELLLHRRDEQLRLEDLTKVAEAKIRASDLKGRDLADAMASLAELNNLKMRHVQRIEDALTALGKEISGREVIIAKLASDMAHLDQSAAQHKDKMVLAAKVVQPSGADIRKKLADKYGVSEEEVENLINARKVDQEPT